MPNLLFFKKDEKTIYFEPELAMYSIPDKDGDVIHLRIASGDENNTHANIRFSSSSIQSMSLEIQDAEKLLCIAATPDLKYLECKSVLKITRSNDETESIPLVDHRIAIQGDYQKIRNKNGKKVKELCWQDLETVKQEVNEIWQDTFADALSDMYGVEKHTPHRGKSRSEPKGLLSTILNFILIAAVSYALLGLAYKAYKAYSNPIKVQTQNTVLETLSPESLNEQAELSKTQDDEQSAEQIALAEFGLEEGIKLD